MTQLLELIRITPRPPTMVVQQIACALIDVPEISRRLRTVNEDFVRKLADSIALQGLMYHPIAVRVKADDPGRYLLVQGRHRFLAKKDVLKHESIDCNVLELNDEEAELATIAENLWRQPLTKAQLAICDKKWLAYFAERYPDKVVRRNTGSKATDKARRDRKSRKGQATDTEKKDDAAAKDAGGASTEATGAETKDGGYDAITGAAEGTARAPEGTIQAPEGTGTETTDNETKDGGCAEEDPGSFAQAVADSTGQSLSSAECAQRIAQPFTGDQFRILVEKEVSETDMITIAKIEDVTLRGEVIDLIEMGVEPRDAIEEVMKDKAPIRSNGESHAEIKAKAAAEAERVPDLTDDEWFEKFCGEKAASLDNPKQYKIDALLFRATSESRHLFYSKVERVLDSHRWQPERPPFLVLLDRFTSIAHPKDWPTCTSCRGSGQVSKGECRKCSGGGYKLETEDWPR